MRGTQAKKIRKSLVEMGYPDKNTYRYVKRKFKQVPRNLKTLDKLT